MRLLLDEHFAPEIARQLRDRRGHDVEAVSGNARLEMLSDALLLDYAMTVARVLVTENVVDFMPLHAERLARGAHHAGLILTSPRRFPRSKQGFGRLIEALDQFLRRFGEQSDPRDQAYWLP